MRAPAESAVTAGDVLTLPELRHLQRVSGPRGAMLVAHAWIVIAGAMLVYALWPSALTLAVAVVIIGGRQLGLAVLMHEATHWRLSPRPKANDRIALWLCAYPVGAELVRYRRRHHQHHRHTRQADDPDLGLSAPFPVARASFWWSVTRDLTGVTAVTRCLGAFRRYEGVSDAWRQLRGPLVANLSLLGVLAALGQWRLYALLWALPLITWYQLVTRVRNLAEHALTPDAGDPLRNTRTVRAGVLARLLLAPYWVNYHLEHHLLVFVPCWKLREAHALLLAKGYGPRMEVAPSYADVIRRVTAAG